jgi:hypothetical protein
MTSQLDPYTLSKQTAKYILERYDYQTGSMSEICELQIYRISSSCSPIETHGKHMNKV